jgi:hypothetical protein
MVAHELRAENTTPIGVECSNVDDCKKTVCKVLKPRGNKYVTRTQVRKWIKKNHPDKPGAPEQTDAQKNRFSSMTYAQRRVQQEDPEAWRKGWDCAPKDDRKKGVAAFKRATKKSTGSSTNRRKRTSFEEAWEAAREMNSEDAAKAFLFYFESNPMRGVRCYTK